MSNVEAKMKIEGVEINNIKPCSRFKRVKGLMFVRQQKAKPLLFSFNKPTRIKIHSWFVFFSFIAIWLDNENNILEKRIVKPFKISIPKKFSYKLLEVPIY